MIIVIMAIGGGISVSIISNTLVVTNNVTATASDKNINFLFPASQEQLVGREERDIFIIEIHSVLFAIMYGGHS